MDLKEYNRIESYAKSNLCHHDTRNPIDEQKTGRTAWCQCYNCYDGRTGLAEEIMDLLSLLKDSIE